MKIQNPFKIIIIVLLLAGFIPADAQNPADFELISATDKSHFRLSESKGKFVALHFLLKTECPYCLRHTHEYYSNAGNLPDVLHIFIKPDTEQEIASWAKKIPEDELVKFPVYRDPEANLAKQFRIPDGYNFHNQVVHYPALILLGTDGKEVYRYIGKSNSDRFSFEKLVLKINELKGK